MNKLTAEKMAFTALFFACVNTSVSADGLVEDVHTLSSDETISVAANEVHVISNLYGGAYTLTKRGEGTLVLGLVTNPAVTVQLESGTLASIPVPSPSNLLYNAKLHIDAINSSMTLASSGGTNFISKIADARPAAATTKTTFPPLNAERKPWVRENFENGMRVIDMGTLYSTEYPELENGHGGAIKCNTEQSNCTQVFIVWADNEDDVSRVLPTGCEEGYVGPCLFAANNVSFTRGLGGGNVRFPLASQVADRISKGTLRIDGALVSAGDASKFKSYTAPKGLHVFELSVSAPSSALKIGGFGCRYDGTTKTNPYGGMVLAEAIAAGNKNYAYDESDMARIRGYLTTKWLKCQRIGNLKINAASGAKVEFSETGFVADRLEFAGRTDLALGSYSKIGSDGTAVISRDTELCFNSLPEGGFNAIRANFLELEGAAKFVFKVQEDVEESYGKKHKVIDVPAEHITGDVGKVVRTVLGHPETTARLSCETDGIYVTFLEKKGLVLLLK